MILTGSQPNYKTAKKIKSKRSKENCAKINWEACSKCHEKYSQQFWPNQNFVSESYILILSQAPLGSPQAQIYPGGCPCAAQWWMPQDLKLSLTQDEAYLSQH